MSCPLVFVRPNREFPSKTVYFGRCLNRWRKRTGKGRYRKRLGKGTSRPAGSSRSIPIRRQHPSSQLGNTSQNRVSLPFNERRKRVEISLVKMVVLVPIADAIRSGTVCKPSRFVGFIVRLGDGFILHHQNSPAALSGHTCARGSAHPTYYCRADTMYRQLDCPPPRKGSCLL